MIRPWRPPRQYVKWGCFLLAILLLLPFPFWIDHSRTLVQASPFAAICTVLTGAAFGIGSILGLIFAAIALVRNRWFCRNICPVGLLLDTVTGIGPGKYSWWKKSPYIGRYIALLTLTGAVTGYPLFLWMDPLAFFNSAFSVYTAANLLSAFLSLTGIIVLLLIALTSGNLWCARLCPLGATQDILAGIVSFLKRPLESINSKRREQSGIGYTFSATRRTFLTIVTGTGLSLYAKKVRGADSLNDPLHPPGAIEKDEFSGQCLRCGNCMRVCPSKIIHPDTGQAGLLGLLAPVVRFKKEYCVEKCNLCTMVCPSGALQKLSLKQKQEYVIGEAILDASLCYLVRGVNDCNICERSCPFDAIQFYWDDEAYVAFPVVDTLKCNGCGACEVYCPTGKIKAIRVWKAAG
ncbi:4Fe-4S dicluster domain-containing protein [Thermodesulfobacteriota bacterium]